MKGNRWWDKLKSETWAAHTVLSELQNKDFLKTCKLLLVSGILIIAAIFISFLQPIYVADKLMLIECIVCTFLVGFGVAISLQASRTSDVFEAVAHAKNNRLVLRDGTVVKWSKEANHTEWSTLAIEALTKEKVVTA